MNSPSGSTMQCDTWLWDDVIEFAQTSAILKFYIWFRFRPHHRSRHAPVSEILSKSHRPRQKINDVMSIFKIADLSHLGFYGSSNGFCEKPNYITSYRSSIDTVALNCLVFKKIAFFCILSSRSKMADLRHLGFRGPIMGSLKSTCMTSYRSLIDNMALNCLVFEKITFLQFGDRQSNRRARCVKPLSLSRAAA